jgi:hypothetical protein
MVVLVAALAAVAMALAGCVPRPGYELVVSSGGDGVDGVPGDGVCEVTSGVGECTLRAAVLEANALAAGSPVPVVVTVTLAVDVTLGSVGGDEDLGASGDLDLDVGASEVRLQGAGHSVDAAGLDRAFDVRSGTVGLDQVVVTGGRSIGPGGGMRTAAGTTTSVLRSTFVDNRALVHGACFASAYFDGCKEAAGYGGTAPIGGGAISNGGSLTVVASTFDANGADSDVSPICVGGSPMWMTCAATWGGAIQSSGALYVGISTFTESDIDLPLHLVDGTPIYGEPFDPFGAAIYATGPSEVASSTVVDDTGPLPDRAVVAGSVQSSIVVSGSCGEPVIDADHNLRSPVPCGTPAPSWLGPLADNGGPTRTVLPTATSLGVDAIAWADCLGFTADQRGEPRVEGQACDIGAVERQPTDA